MKSNCMKREQIFALAESMLSAREEEQARAHLAGCEDCRKVFESYRRVDSVLDEWMPEAEPSPWFDARMRAAVAAAGSANRSRGFLGLTLNRWLALPAMASLLVITGVVAYRDLRSRPSGGPGNTAAVTSAARAVQAAPAAQVASPAGAPAHEAATQELKMYQNLPVLEDYDMLAGFDVISELPKGSGKIAD
ncbi:MAG TPA: zf-HC2 domain-containing protein [Terriglobia bacterium]